MTISIPERQVRALGGAAVALAVMPRATLLPKAFAGDPSPQTAAEIARATGEDRAIGEDQVDQGGPLAEAAGTIMTMINALIARENGPGGRDAAADARLARRPSSRTAAPPGAEREALQDRVDLCSGLAKNACVPGRPVELPGGLSRQLCQHADGRYWDAVATGY